MAPDLPGTGLRGFELIIDALTGQGASGKQTSQWVPISSTRRAGHLSYTLAGTRDAPLILQPAARPLR